jgi:hypothetical protein
MRYKKRITFVTLLLFIMVFILPFNVQAEELKDVTAEVMC